MVSIIKRLNSLILFIYLLQPILTAKDCFCSNRIDGYSLSAIQLYFLDYAGKESFEIILDKLVAIYNSVVRNSVNRFPSLPYLQLTGEGFSPRWVFKPNVLDEKYTSNQISSSPKGAFSAKRVKNYIKQIDNKRVYQFGETTFYVYYYQNRRNKVTWSVEFTTEERRGDTSTDASSIPEDKQVDPQEEQPVFKDPKISDQIQPSDVKLSIKDIRRKDYKGVNWNANDLNKMELEKLDLSHLKQLRHRYTFSHYLEGQFEFDMCANFQIFVNKLLRKFYDFGTELHPDLKIPLYGISSLLTTPDNKCQSFERDFNIFLPADITRFNFKSMMKLIKDSTNIEKKNIQSKVGILIKSLELKKKEVLNPGQEVTKIFEPKSKDKPTLLNQINESPKSKKLSTNYSDEISLPFKMSSSESEDPSEIDQQKIDLFKKKKPKNEINFAKKSGPSQNILNFYDFISGEIDESEFFSEFDNYPTKSLINPAIQKEEEENVLLKYLNPQPSEPTHQKNNHIDLKPKTIEVNDEPFDLLESLQSNPNSFSEPSLNFERKKPIYNQVDEVDFMNNYVAKERPQSKLKIDSSMERFTFGLGKKTLEEQSTFRKSLVPDFTHSIKNRNIYHTRSPFDLQPNQNFKSSSEPIIPASYFDARAKEIQRHRSFRNSEILDNEGSSEHHNTSESFGSESLRSTIHNQPQSRFSINGERRAGGFGVKRDSIHSAVQTEDQGVQNGYFGQQTIIPPMYYPVGYPIGYQMPFYHPAPVLGSQPMNINIILNMNKDGSISQGNGPEVPNVSERNQLFQSNSVNVNLETNRHITETQKAQEVNNNPSSNVRDRIDDKEYLKMKIKEFLEKHADSIDKDSSQLNHGSNVQSKKESTVIDNIKNSRRRGSDVRSLLRDNIDEITKIIMEDSMEINETADDQRIIITEKPIKDNSDKIETTSNIPSGLPQISLTSPKAKEDQLCTVKWSNTSSKPTINLKFDENLIVNNFVPRIIDEKEEISEHKIEMEDDLMFDGITSRVPENNTPTFGVLPDSLDESDFLLDLEINPDSRALPQKENDLSLLKKSSILKKTIPSKRFTRQKENTKKALLQVPKVQKPVIEDPNLDDTNLLDESIVSNASVDPKIEPIYVEPKIRKLNIPQCKQVIYSNNSNISKNIDFCEVLESIIKVEIKEITIDDSIIGDVEDQKEKEKQITEPVVQISQSTNKITEVDQKLAKQSEPSVPTETEEEKQNRINKRLLELAQEIEKRKIFIRPLHTTVQHDMDFLMADGVFTDMRKEEGVFSSRTSSTLNYKSITHPGNELIRGYDCINNEACKLLKLEFKRKTRFVSLLIRYLAILKELDADIYGELWFVVYKDLKIAFSSEKLRDRLTLHILCFHQYQLITGAVHQKGVDGLVDVKTSYKYLKNNMETEVEIRNKEELPGQEVETYQKVIKTMHANLPPISRKRRAVVFKPTQNKIQL